MKELNDLLSELGISKVRLAKYLGVSRQMLYNYLSLGDIYKWPKEKFAKLFTLLNVDSYDELIKKEITGEYIIDSNIMWRIIEPIEDGTTKVVSVVPITSFDSDLTFVLEPEHEKIVYDPKDKTSLGYFINNRLNKYVNTSIFENHIINVPIYKNKIVYKEEVENKKYKTTLSAPDMYEMFSAQARNLSGISSRSYWLINSSKAKNTAGIITDIGVPLNEKIPEYYTAGVRVVGYLKKDIIISGGKGTENSPYIIK